MPHAKGTDLGGIRKMSDLLSRCKPGDNGCMVWTGGVHEGRAVVWVASLMRSCSMSLAIQYLREGKQREDGKVWLPRCGNALCAAPEHRVLCARSEMMHTLRPKLDQVHRDKIAAAKRRQSRVLTPELVASILTSNETPQQAAARVGISVSHVHRIRCGQAWGDKPAKPNARRKPNVLAGTLETAATKVTRATSLGYDRRYQCGPGQAVSGAGFSAAGIGRYLD